jgi:hypothetical protein
MPTNRTPLARQSTAPINPQAVELYLKMRRIRCSCPPPELGRSAPSTRDQCGHCERWWSLHSALDEALGPAKPWLWPHLPPPTRILHADGSIRPRQPNQHMIELEQRLKAARTRAIASP